MISGLTMAAHILQHRRLLGGGESPAVSRDGRSPEVP